MEKYDENTSKIQTKSLEIVNLTEQKDAPISIVSSPDTTQWEKNFSNRWATKQYTKKEIICALNDVNPFRSYFMLFDICFSTLSSLVDYYSKATSVSFARP